MISQNERVKELINDKLLEIKIQKAKKQVKDIRKLADKIEKISKDRYDTMISELRVAWRGSGVNEYIKNVCETEKDGLEKVIENLRKVANQMEKIYKEVEKIEND